MKTLKIPKIIYLIIAIIIISTIFSSSFFTSLLGNSSKSHSAIMFLNLIGLFIVFINSDKKLLKNLIKTTLISSFFVLLMGIKEYYFPTFDYGDLSNRAISTFGHPNYLALYILIITPLIFKPFTPSPLGRGLGGGHYFIQRIGLGGGHYFIQRIGLIGGLLILSIFVLLLTKSAWGILIFLIYIFYKIKPYIPSPLRRGLGGGIFLILILILFYNFGLITKLHSFLSRFFIWETTLRIIFSNIKIFLFGGGLGTLEFVFDSFKSPYLYIFENIGFTADRSHNLFLNFLYNFGILGFSFIIYILIKIMKYYKLSLLNKSFSENIPYLESLFLFFIFTIFNFSGITGYLIILLIGAIIYKNTLLENKGEDFNLKYLKLKYLNINSNILKNILQVSFVLISIFGIYFYTNYYIQEHKLHEDNNYKSNNYLYNKIKQEDYEKNLWNESFINLEDMCKKKINYSNSVENYFYCGDLLWNNNEKLALEYYNSGLSKLPDLWNEDSKYNKQFLINNFVDKKRFFSDKYNNLIEILEKVGKNK